MLAEKFFLVLETLRSNASSDIIIVSATPHIPVKSEHPTHLPFQDRSFIGRAEGTGIFFADPNSPLGIHPRIVFPD